MLNMWPVEDPIWYNLQVEPPSTIKMVHRPLSAKMLPEMCRNAYNLGFVLITSICNFYICVIYTKGVAVACWPNCAPHKMGTTHFSTKACEIGGL